MGWPVITVASGGMPVTDVTATTGRGTPVTEATNKFGCAVTKVASGGMAVVYETIGGGSGGGTLTTWNPADKSANIVLSNSNLTAQGTIGGTDQAVRSTTGKSSGKIYVETTWATGAGQVDVGVGLATAAAILTSVGTTVAGAVTCYANSGTIYNNNGTTTGVVLGAFAASDVISLALDLTNLRVWFRKNAGNWNNSGTANPATNVGGLSVSAQFTSAAAYLLHVNNQADAAGLITANFGALAFTQSVPSGFVSWNAGS